MLRTTGFHHVTLVSGGMARTHAFYSGLLGLRLVKRTVNFDDPSSYHLYYGVDGGAPGTLLTFFDWSGIRRGRWGVGGVHHVALGVATPEAQLKWKRRLSDAGVEVSGPYDRGYFRSIYFRDPDGQILEIATEGPGYAVDEPLEALGRSEQPPPSGADFGAGRDEAAIAALTHPEPVVEVDAEMALTGLHHVSGITRDMEPAHAFYTEALGLTRVKRTVNQDDGRTPHHFWAAYDGRRVAPASAMTLFGWAGSEYLARPGVGQVHHVAFRVADDAELEGWREQLGSAGADVSPVIDRRYFRSLYFRAPDGLLLELATDGPGFDVDEAPEALGVELKLPPWLERRRPEIAGELAALGV